MVARLCATLLLERRRAAYAIPPSVPALASRVPLVHMPGKGLSPVAATPGGHTFVWTLFAPGVSATLSAILALGGSWRSWRAARE